MQKTQNLCLFSSQCLGAIILRWKSLKLLQTPLKCKHVPLQTLPLGNLERFNWPADSTGPVLPYFFDDELTIVFLLWLVMN